MPRQQGTLVQNSFVRGLVTETTALQFPQDACTETLNVIFDETGRVTRRPAFDLESNYTLESLAKEDDEVFTEYTWSNVAGLGTISFLVQQKGSIVHFYDISDSTEISDNKVSFTIDLNDYVPGDSTELPEIYKCDYAQGNGSLIIVNPVTDIITCQYIVDEDEFIVNTYEITVRDLVGLQDGLLDAERPTFTISGIKTGNPQHYYNILNQGWFSGDALSQWDSARTDMPSNSDIVALYRSSATDAFDNAIVTGKSPGNALAAKGHFLLSATNPNRNSALQAEGFTDVGDLSSASEFPVPDSVGSRIGDGQESSGFLGPFIFWDEGVNNGWFGKDYGSIPRVVTKARLRYYSNSYVSGSDPSITVVLRGKNGSAPSGRTDGTQLGTITFTDSSATPRVIEATGNTTAYRYLWFDWAATTGDGNFRVSRTTDFYIENPGQTQISTNFRPSQVEFYAGRAWYAGINDQSLSNTIYFSQIIERPDQYGKCYQANDPTAEDFFDLLSSDGGTIKIPEMGTVTKLYAFQTTLIVYASNGIWLISGSAGSPFKADDYQVKKVGSIGTQSGLSFVDVKGNPVWWAEEGIYGMQYDPNYDSFTPKSITDQTIKEVILGIPQFNRQFVKGSYDPSTDQVIWLYNSSENLTSENYYKYDKMLVLNTLSQAFYLWDIQPSDQEIRGIIYVQTASRVDEDIIKYVTTVDIDSSTEYLTYSDQKTTVFYDWASNEEVDYSSYFVTGYTYPSQPDKYFQGNYIQVFLETLDLASCRLQGRWDWTNSGNSGKWSSYQQIYNSLLNYRDINFRKLKLRGKGKTLQLRFESESGRPFSIIGWTTWITSNAQV